MPIQGEADASQAAGVGLRNEVRSPVVQVLDPNLPQLQPRADQDCAILLGRQSAQTQWVVNGFQLLELLEVLEVVNEDLVLERHDDLVPPKLDAQNSAVEAELAEASGGWSLILTNSTMSPICWRYGTRPRLKV